MYNDFTLLTDGKNAFPEIVNAIAAAQKSVHINMFIWRDDNVGNLLGETLLKAANRGVRVYISVDRYGVVLEKAEESKKSFFHKKQSFTEKVKIKALECIYPMHGAPKKATDEYTQLYTQMLAHPNITVSENVFKADHSKFYVIDEKILFLGGINVEDKENGKDMQGRAYQDYMVKIVGDAHVAAFWAKLNRGENVAKGYFFGINRKTQTPPLWEMENVYLDMINGANKNLQITMAYFSPLKKFINAIVAAYKRGVKITVMIPSFANFQNDTNRKTVKKLMKKTNDGITLYFSPKMVHTKMLIADEKISFGSTNITKKAFCQLDELNLCIANADCDFVETLRQSVEENYLLSQKITSYKQIKYNGLLAFLEGFLV